MVTRGRLVREILKLAPELSSFDTYFYERPVDHVLSGFALDLTTSDAYITRYAIPLYDRFKFLHFGFGGRLPMPAGYMDMSVGTARYWAKEFISRIRPYKAEIAKLSNVECFADYLERDYVALGTIEKNYILRRGYAVTLIMLGRGKEAEEELDALLSMERVKRDPEARAELTTLKENLLRDLAAAREMLDEWELEAKRSLNLVDVH